MWRKTFQMISQTIVHLKISKNNLEKRGIADLINPMYCARSGPNW